MIVLLTGTLIEATPSRVVLDVHGVGYELGVSSTTAASLPALGEPGVTLYVRMVVREDAVALFGFSSREERALFDHLTSVTGVGPKLALSVLSTFSPQALASVVAMGDETRMAQVPGVGKKMASRLVLELGGVFGKDEQLFGLVPAPLAPGHVPAASGSSATTTEGILADVTSALLSMGFTPQEATLALEGCEEAGAVTPEKAVAYALRRLGRGA